MEVYPPPSQWPPERPQEKSLWKKILTSLGVAGVAIAKYAASLKFLIFPIIKFLPILLKTGGSMLFMIVVYGYMYGWPWAVGFVLLILIHECGHLIAAREMGLKVGAPVFIPFMGAMIALKEAPKNAWIEAIVGIGGPVAGSVGALACHTWFLHTGSPVWGALAYSGYFLNLFNLIPLSPLDGGRIATAISPWLWVVGIGIMGWMLFQGFLNPLLIIILIMSAPRLINLFRRQEPENQRYFELQPGQRLIMSASYFGLAAMLAVGMHRVMELMQMAGNWRN